MKLINENKKLAILILVIVLFIADCVLMIIVAWAFPEAEGLGKMMIGALIAWGGQLMTLIGLGVKEWFDGKPDNN